MLTSPGQNPFRLATSAALLITAIVGCDRVERSTSDEVPPLRTIIPTAEPAQGGQAPECLISVDGVGAIRLGRTLAEARGAMPNAKFERTSDGEGIALVEVSFGTDLAVIISAGEGDRDAPIDWSKTVRSIETFSPNCQTIDGIHPGILVVDVVTVFGPVRQIVRSEIESREYITFEQQPTALTLRLDYTGEFPEGSRETQIFAAGARIFSVLVSTSGTQ